MDACKDMSESNRAMIEGLTAAVTALDQTMGNLGELRLDTFWHFPRFPL
jgi:hypothetical protein